MIQSNPHLITQNYSDSTLLLNVSQNFQQIERSILVLLVLSTSYQVVIAGHRSDAVELGATGPLARAVSTGGGSSEVVAARVLVELTFAIAVKG